MTSEPSGNPWAAGICWVLMARQGEHQVNHNAKISHVYHVFSSYEEGGQKQARARRGVWPYSYNPIPQIKPSKKYYSYNPIPQIKPCQN